LTGDVGGACLGYMTTSVNRIAEVVSARVLVVACDVGVYTSRHVVAPFISAHVVVVAVDVGGGVDAPGHFVANRDEALIGWQRVAVNVSPLALAIGCALLECAHVVVIAGSGVANGTFHDTSARGLPLCLAQSSRRNAISVEAVRVLCRRTNDGGVADALACSRRGRVVIALEGATQVVGCRSSTVRRYGRTAHLSIGHGVLDTGRAGVAGVGGLALSASAESTARSTR